MVSNEVALPLLSGGCCADRARKAGEAGTYELRCQATAGETSVKSAALHSELANEAICLLGLAKLLDWIQADAYIIA